MHSYSVLNVALIFAKPVGLTPVLNVIETDVGGKEVTFIDTFIDKGCL